jgi:RNA polymerase sigma factor (sigma-70 family)
MEYDTRLLRQYIETGSERAFRELVERHIQLVNSTALRSVAGDVHLAKDVTQMVFTDLARKAGNLPADVVLGGWLHRHTCFTAAKMVRGEIRRRNRERTAMEINAANESPSAEAQWQRLAPVLDDALNHLGAQDRDAIVLRYLQCRDLRSIGVAIGTSEDAAQKRIARALEKLRGFLAGRGITFSGAMLGTALEAAAKTPVPAGLAANISAAALSGAAKTTFTLTTLKTMITSKLSLTVASVAAIACITAAVVTNHNSLAADPSPAAAASSDAMNATDGSAAVSPTPASVAGTGTSGANASIMIGGPTSGQSGSYSTSVQVSKGVVTTTKDDNGNVVTQVQRIPASGVVSGSEGAANFVVASGTAAASVFPMPTGVPTSSRVNADGSTTSVYTNPQGGITDVTVSADGKSRSMRISAPPSGASN